VKGVALEFEPVLEMSTGLVNFGSDAVSRIINSIGYRQCKHIVARVRWRPQVQGQNDSRSEQLLWYPVCPPMEGFSKGSSIVLV